MSDMKNKEVLVSLNWHELDEIGLALRICNKTFKGNMHDELERKISNWSMKAKGAM